MTAPGTAPSFGFSPRAPLPAWALRLLWGAFLVGTAVGAARWELAGKADKSEVKDVVHKVDRVLDLLCYDRVPQPRPCMDRDQ